MIWQAGQTVKLKTSALSRTLAGFTTLRSGMLASPVFAPVFVVRGNGAPGRTPSPRAGRGQGTLGAGANL